MLKKDYAKSAVLYQKTCDSGDAIGCNNLGLAYQYGHGMKQNMNKANELYGKACNLKSQSGCDNYAKLKRTK